jgi:DNA-binding phage protein
MVKTAAFDAADYLNDEETIAEYLTAALEDPNPDLISNDAQPGTPTGLYCT